MVFIGQAQQTLTTAAPVTLINNSLSADCPTTITFNTAVSNLTTTVFGKANQKSLDSTNTAVNDHTTQISSLTSKQNSTAALLAGTNNTVIGITNQTSVNQADISGLNTRVTFLESAGSGGQVTPTPTPVTTSTYTITQADNNGTLLIKNKCTISFSITIAMPFTCKIIEQGATNAGQVSFTGINITSGNSWKRIKYQYGKIDAIATSTGMINISGDLKL